MILKWPYFHPENEICKKTHGAQPKLAAYFQTNKILNKTHLHYIRQANPEW